MILPKSAQVARRVLIFANESLYPPGEQVGKATAQVGRNDKGDFVSGDSEFYDKWAQALASAHELVLAGATRHEAEKESFFASVVIPILVVSDGTLWAADYSEDGVLQVGPHQVGKATLFVGRDYSGWRCPVITLTHLHIFTRSSVVDFLRDLAARDGPLWARALPEQAIKASLAKR